MVRPESLRTADKIIPILRFLLSLFSIFASPLLFCDEETWIEKLEKSLSHSIVIGKQYVFIIAIDKYPDKNWADLQYPVRKAREIREILSLNYRIDRFFELYDEQATKEQILRAFADLQNSLEPEDSLFILYSGHGYYDDDVTQTGFWIPVNAGYDRFKQENWIPNPQIRGIISKFEAKHILLVSDSCFAGDIIETYKGENVDSEEKTDDQVTGSMNKVSREVITSGSMENVPDDPEFADQIRIALRANVQPYFDSLDLYQSIRTGVMESKPVYAVLPTAKHQQGGSFFFYRVPEAERLPDGTLSVKVKKPGDVFINGRFAGTIDEKVSFARDFPPEKITVTLRYGDGSESSRQVEIKSGENIDIVFEDYPIHHNLGNNRITVSAGTSIGFPLDVYWSDLYKLGFAADFSLKYALMLPVGYAPVGFVTGVKVFTMEEDLEDTYTSYTVPVGLSIGYTYTFPFPLSVFVETSGGMVLVWLDYKMNGESDKGPIASPYASVACGLGVYVTRRITLEVFGNLSWLFFGNITYTDIQPGIRCNLNI